jgi:hypothetical protein
MDAGESDGESDATVDSDDPCDAGLDDTRAAPRAGGSSWTRCIIHAISTPQHTALSSEH